MSENHSPFTNPHLAEAKSGTLDFNKALELAICEIAAGIPVAGGFLSGVVGALWPESAADPMAVWNTIAGYVEAYIQTAVNAEHIRRLNNALEGIRNVYRRYESTPYDSLEKSEWLVSAQAAVELEEPDFFDQSNPEQTLPYFVALGTLKLVTLVEDYNVYEKIHKVPDPEREAKLRRLKSETQRFSDGAKAAKERAISQRIDLIEVFPTKSYDGITWTVKDAHVSNPSKPDQIDYQRSFEGHNAERDARSVYTTRRERIQSQLGDSLDEFLSPTYLWKYLDPTCQDSPKRTPVDVSIGPFGGATTTAFSDESCSNQPITKVVIHAGRQVDGVEIFYGGKSGGLHGGTGGQQYTLELEEGEHIVFSAGGAGGSVDSLYFKTNKGRQVGGGGDGGEGLWISSVPEGKEDAHFSHISGWANENSLEAITLIWRYYRNQ